MGRIGTKTKDPQYMKEYYQNNKASYEKRNKEKYLQKRYNASDEEIEKYGIKNMKLFKEFTENCKKMKELFSEEFDQIINSTNNI